eukprot:CAMPEP_0198113438 /NCGR_PEP_ID=MMETSP1442-20131203/5108_1 /TAXON_ID= /ORGANISM="Craspedostauros australis, Strain CCMP3328" /LENGTH=366 /DNA_ID=CAMNT_0043770523 /DNA_START=41 /DNA_END=1141 /DNA_ORIENTATION=-
MPDCFVATAAVLMFAANALLIVYYVKERERSHFDRDLFEELDPAYIRLEWDHRIDNTALWTAAGFINGFAWLFLCVPIIELSWILSRRGTSSTSLHLAIAFFALAGSFTEWISRLYFVGSNIATRHLARNFNLDRWISNNVQDDLGWRALEVTHLITSAYVWFLDAFEWICLSIILILTYSSVRHWREHDSSTFDGCWNALGLFIGLMCILEFVAEILRFDGYRTFGPIAIVYAVLNRLILIPIWLLTLSFLLPRATAKSEAAPNELELSTMDTAVAPPANTNPLSPPAAAFAQSPLPEVSSVAESSVASTLPPPESVAESSMASTLPPPPESVAGSSMASTLPPPPDTVVQSQEPDDGPSDLVLT